MKQHEREYFISVIRSGKIFFNRKDINLEILTPTIDEEVLINKVYLDTYDSCLQDGCMTFEENVEWMINNNLWSKEEDQKIETIEENIEKLKIKIFEERNNEGLVKSGKVYLRASEKALNKLHEKKNLYFSKTCEGISTTEKTYELIKKCTRYNGSLYSFNEYSLDHITNFFYSQILPESKIRFLARSEPWRTLWSVYENKIDSLFLNGNRELSIDQKNLLIWSKMYDNIQESLDCPEQDVINDDDMLDGWFIIQRKKREQEKKEKSMEEKLNSKVSNSQEVFLMAGNKKEAKNIDSINTAGAQFIKKQRFAQIKMQKEVNQMDLKDERMNLQTRAAQGLKNKFRR